jgi:mannan endo-1,4-beta-mannosidase
MAALLICFAANLNQTAQAAESAGALLFATPTNYTPQNIGVKELPVYRIGGANGAVSVVCSTTDGTATAPQYYSAITQTLHWADHDAAPKYCQVPINDSVPYSGFKRFTAKLSSISGAAIGENATSIVTIAGNRGSGQVTLSAPAYSVTQKAGNVVVSVMRTGGAHTNALVFYTTTSQTAIEGTDFTAAQGILQWMPGDGSPKTFSIPLNTAKAFKGVKTLGVQIYQAHEAELGSTTKATVSITGSGVSTQPKNGSKGGFFVSAGKLYDANGNEFRIRGVDRCHFDSPSQPGISNSGANAVRMFMWSLSNGAAKYAEVVQTQHINNKEVPILTMSPFPDGTMASCNSDTNELASGVDWWVANAATFTPLDRYMMINIANEWGPRNSTAWRDAYISAVTRMRAAGYHSTLVIDAGGCGQDMGDLLNYSAAVFNADPDNNVLFSLHIYGGTPDAAVANSNLAQLSALSASTGMAFVVGEFGPGRNIGPSPTMLTPGEVITAAENNGIGWIAWAWDDNDLGGGSSDNNWFSMTYHGPGEYSQTSDLTIYGQDVVLNPTYGLQALAKPATIF